MALRYRARAGDVAGGRPSPRPRLPRAQALESPRDPASPRAPRESPVATRSAGESGTHGTNPGLQHQEPVLRREAAARERSQDVATVDREQRTQLLAVRCEDAAVVRRV